MLVAAISALGLAASLALCVRAVRSARAADDTVPPSAIAWAVAFMLIQGFVCVWAALGLVAQDFLAVLVLNLVLTGCAWASASRPRVAARLLALKTPRRGKPVRPLVAGTLAIVAASAFAVLGLEIPSNHDLTWMYPLCLLLEWFIVLLPMLALHFISQRRGAAPAVLAVLLHILGIAEYFVITFKSMPIQPGDLSALGTAMAVSSGYVYRLGEFCLYGMAFAAVSLMLCQLSVIWRPEVRPGDATVRGRRMVNLLVGLACLAGLTAHVTLIDYYNTLYVQVYTWRPLESYYREGFLPCFISSAQTIIPRKPQDYSEASAQKLVDEYAADYDASEGASEARSQASAQFDEEKPTVIAIMNETFSDLSIYQNLHANYQGPQFFKSLSDCLQRGTLYVSAYGGGTANTEFEFLTGNSMAYLGSGVYPYTIYDVSETENLAAQFKSLGYTTTAMHPNHATNWNRENVYGQFGFDQFLSIDDFQDADRLRGMVTDQATYDKILQLLEENEDPQFIFDVTMQNHSGYDTGLLPAELQEQYYIDGISDPEVNEYLSLIHQSDEALQYFINALRQLDRKVVVVFFGDHQPFFPDRYNTQWFADEDAATHAERLWQTNYIIWANYDVAGRNQGSDVDDISTNYLASELMDLIGAPLTDYQKAQQSLRAVMPAINATGFEDRDLRWYLSSAAVDDSTDADTRRARQDLQTMQYYKLFGDGKDIFTKALQGAANETDPNLAPGTTKIK